MSKIVKARRTLIEANDRLATAMHLIRECIELQKQALTFMVREKAVRRARPRRTIVTPELRDKVTKLARRYPNMTTSEIAVKCGLRSAGRVSEILHNQR